MVPLLPYGGKLLRGGAGNLLDRIPDLIGVQPLQYLPHIKLLGTGQHGVHAPLAAEHLGQGTGIHPLDAGDVMLLHIIPQVHLSAEVAPPGGQMANHQHLHPGAAGLVVLAVHPVVADEGIGHDHALSGIGGIGQDLLVASHGGVEHQLAHPCLCAPDAGTGEDASVFQDQSRFQTAHSLPM